MKIELESLEYPVYKPSEGGEIFVEATEEQLKDWQRVMAEFERVQEEMYQAADAASHEEDAEAIVADPILPA